MLQTSCPKCMGTIQSPYLNDLSTVECTDCNESVAVEDVFIATKGFTMHRGDLLNRISRFQRLLREVEKELASMENDDSVSARTRKSVEQFYQTLQELLAGARNHFRLEIPSGLCVEIGEEELNSAKVTNLSSEGASIACKSMAKFFAPSRRSNCKCHYLVRPRPCHVSQRLSGSAGRPRTQKPGLSISA